MESGEGCSMEHFLKFGSNADLYESFTIYEISSVLHYGFTMH